MRRRPSAGSTKRSCRYRHERRSVASQDRQSRPAAAGRAREGRCFRAWEPPPTRPMPEPAAPGPWRLRGRHGGWRRWCPWPGFPWRSPAPWSAARASWSRRSFSSWCSRRASARKDRRSPASCGHSNEGKVFSARYAPSARLAGVMPRIIVSEHHAEERRGQAAWARPAVARLAWRKLAGRDAAVR